MTYSFHPEAHAEFKEATLYYSEKNPSLAAAFYAEIEYAIEGIAQNPLLYNVIDEDIRRCMTKRFPYAILYTIEDHYILILAAMHCGREPSYWKQSYPKNRATANNCVKGMGIAPPLCVEHFRKN